MESVPEDVKNEESMLINSTSVDAGHHVNGSSDAVQPSRVELTEEEKRIQQQLTVSKATNELGMTDRYRSSAPIKLRTTVPATPGTTKSNFFNFVEKQELGANEAEVMGLNDRGSAEGLDESKMMFG